MSFTLYLFQTLSNYVMQQLTITIPEKSDLQIAFVFAF